MSDKTLNIRTFAETFRERMNKKASIKDFDTGSEITQSKDLTQVFHFYYHLLKAVIYNVDEVGIPDIVQSMTTKLKKGNAEIHPKIKEIAQRKETRKSVVDYFSTNLIPNIPQPVLSSVLDDINVLVQSDTGIGKEKRKSLRKLRSSSKDGASYLADVWLLAICNGTNIINDKKVAAKGDDVEFAQELAGDIVDKIDALLKEFPRPKQITPTSEIAEHEQTYIAALYLAYGDALGVDDCDESVLEIDPVYKSDFAEQRIDYFSAYSVERGLLEFKGRDIENQFDHLKDEIFTGVRYTSQKSFDNGYIKLMEVLDKAVDVQTSLYALSKSPYWISNRIKKGTCHFLVNDGKLVWVTK